MNTEDCKIATEFGGECWHIEMPYSVFSIGYHGCQCCQQPKGKKHLKTCTIMNGKKNRTFTTPDDVYFLIDVLPDKGYDSDFIIHLNSDRVDYNMWDWVFGLTPADQIPVDRRLFEGGRVMQHTYTPEEASTKWCPLTFSLDQDAHKCDTVDCMAWRFAGIIRDSKKGYCGLAGKPTIID